MAVRVTQDMFDPSIYRAPVSQPTRQPTTRPPTQVTPSAPVTLPPVTTQPVRPTTVTQPTGGPATGIGWGSSGGAVSQPVTGPPQGGGVPINDSGIRDNPNLGRTPIVPPSVPYSPPSSNPSGLPPVGTNPPPAPGTPQYAPLPWDPWNPTTPAPWTLPPGATAPGTPSTQPQTGEEWKWYKDNTQALANYVPYAQFMQNAMQYGMDFNEAQRRWNAEFGWTQQQDQFNMGLAGRQQQAAEWQAQEAARQWAAQFGYTQERDARELQLANDQLAVERAYRTGLISNEQRNLALQELAQRQNNELGQGQLQLSRDELAALQQWRNTEAGLRQTEMDNNMMAARYAAFGRSQAPAMGRFQRNW